MTHCNKKLPPKRAAVFTFRTLLSAFPVLRGDEAEDRGHQQDRHGDAARDARGLKSFVHRGLHIAAQAEAHRVVNARARHQRQERDDEVRRDGVFARARQDFRVKRRNDGGEEIHAVNAHAQIMAEQVRHPCEHAAERAENAAPVVHIEEDEKARVKGLIINKFRGDKTILDPGVEMLEERGGVKVAGVVPYMHLSIEDEDSLSGQLDNHDVGVIDLAVIRFPRISNFTDFNVFERLEGVSVRYVSSVQELGQPDMIFLPGSKNTVGDLRWMRQNGLEAAVKKLAAHIPVWGICGGYQMLGRTISDPHGVENENSLREPLYPAHCEAISHEPDTIAVERIRRDGALPLRGMELIDTDTTLMPEKMRTQTRGKFENVTGIFSTLSGLEFSGYEIHMGKTTVSTGEHQTPLVQLADGRTDGVQRMEKGSEAPGVYGSYVHGIFDDGDIAVRIVQALADKKRVSWKPEAGGDYHAFKEQQYDKLAQGLREHLDMEYVYSILQESRISS